MAATLADVSMQAAAFASVPARTAAASATARPLVSSFSGMSLTTKASHKAVARRPLAAAIRCDGDGAAATATATEAEAIPIEKCESQVLCHPDTGKFFVIPTPHKSSVIPIPGALLSLLFSYWLPLSSICLYAIPIRTHSLLFSFFRPSHTMLLHCGIPNSYCVLAFPVFPFRCTYLPICSLRQRPRRVGHQQDQGASAAQVRLQYAEVVSHGVTTQVVSSVGVAQVVSHRWCRTGSVAQMVSHRWCRPGEPSVRLSSQNLG
ncbi:unnamed protein product [Closterium sp. NIES-53]